MGSKISKAIINNEIDTSLKKVKEKAKKIQENIQKKTNTQQQTHNNAVAHCLSFGSLDLTNFQNHLKFVY